MNFQDTSESILAKLHITNVGKPTLLGLGLLSIAVLIAIFQGVVGALGAETSEAYGSDSSVVQTQEQAEVLATSGDDAPRNASASETQPSTIYVHVAGEVAKPGMYELSGEARLDDAINAAGGFTKEAAADSVNLARTLTDGEQIIVASNTQQDSATQAASGEAAMNGGTQNASAQGTSETSVSGKVNINTADVTQLMTLKGVGQATAEKIVADREANGPFASAEDITRVSGIGEKKYAAMKDSITI